MLLAEGEQERRRLRSPVRGAASHLLTPVVSWGGSAQVQPPGLRLGRGLPLGLPSGAWPSCGLGWPPPRWPYVSLVA